MHEPLPSPLLGQGGVPCLSLPDEVPVGVGGILGAGDAHGGGGLSILFLDFVFVPHLLSGVQMVLEEVEFLRLSRSDFLIF